MPTVNVSTYVDVDVDVELDDINSDDLADHLREKGYMISGGTASPKAITDPDVRSFEYLIWQSLRAGKLDELRDLCAEMVRERIGRFA